MQVAEQIAVTGANGQLGAELCQQLGIRAVALDRDSLDITDREAVRYVLMKIRPQVVINAAAYTQVDRAEEDPLACRTVNVEAVRQLAEVCGELDCPFLHVSSDYVFGSRAAREEPYGEDEPTDPQGVYAQSKWDGENEARRHGRHIIVRTCGLYGHPLHPRKAQNFVETMLRLAGQRSRLGVVDDQHCTPSYVRHVAAAIVYLAQSEHQGTYHVVNGGATTWYDFAAEIFRLEGITIQLDPISTEQFGAPAPRPHYCVLDTSKYQALGQGPVLPDWRAALGQYLAWRKSH
jgi:dTDP-4-dehydrorhamnose reductase